MSAHGALDDGVLGDGVLGDRPLRDVSAAPGTPARHRPTHAPVAVRTPRSRIAARRLPIGWVGVALLALLWEVLPRLGAVDPLFLPPLSAVAGALPGDLAHGGLGGDILASLGRAIPGLALAIAAGVPAGLLLGSSAILHRATGPVLELFRNTSALALLPVLTLLLGIGELSKVMMVFYTAFWPILLATMTGVQGVDRLWLKAGRAMGLGRIGLFAHIVVPAAAPAIFTGIRLAAAAALLVLVAAEMVGSRAGLGYLINTAQLDFDIPTMYAAILVLSVIGTATNLALVRIENKLLRWRNG